MKKFEISAQFIGLIITEVEANNAVEAKEKFLTSLNTELNGYGDPSVTLENISVPSEDPLIPKPLVLTELNMTFPNKLTNDDMKYWEGIEIEEMEE
jgi:hypothetical protein